MRAVYCADMGSLITILRDYWIYGAVAVASATLLTPVAIRAAWRWKVLDIPDRKLKPHARPIPYLGGMAICAAWTLSLGAALVLGAVRAWRTLGAWGAGGIGRSILGLVDDIRGLAPRTRLLVGGILIAGVLLLTGVGLELGDSVLLSLQSVTDECGLTLPTAWLDVLRPLARPFSLIFGVLVVLAACNSANLIDGLDGLCSGVTAIISFGFFLLAAHLAVWEFSPRQDPVRLALAIAMFGAALGFLPWNFNPAKIFMGDAGSVLLGYTCGILILLFAERGGILRWVVGALVIFALPMFDTALAMFRRWRSGRSIFEGDRSHFYDQLVQRGFTVRQTVAICYGLTVFFVATGLLLTWVRSAPGGGSAGPMIRTRWALLLYLAVCLAAALVTWWAGLTTPEERRPHEAVQPASDAAQTPSAAGTPDSPKH